MLKDLLAGQEECEKTVSSLNSLKQYPVLIYGAGHDALSLKEFLNNYSIDVADFFVDKEFLNFPHAVKNGILTLEEALQRYDKFNAIVGFHCAPEILEKKIEALQKHNAVNSVHAYDFTWWRSFNGFYQQDIGRQYNIYQEVYTWLADELSKKIFVNFINAKMTHEPKFLLNLQSSPQYFPDDLPLFAPNRNDIVIDGGAYDGDTLKSFISLTQLAGCREYYAFEPEAHNYSQLKNFIASNQLTFAIPFQKGLWSAETTLSFHGSNGMASYLSDQGEIRVEVISIDDLNAAATFIKMDIEGAELEALKGAERTIRKYTPRLAISLYHDPKHLIAIPEYLRQICPGYNFYLRLHSYFSRELVLYATVR